MDTPTVRNTNKHTLLHLCFSSFLKVCVCWFGPLLGLYMNVLNYPTCTSWTEVCLQMHQKLHLKHPYCWSIPWSLHEFSPNMDDRIKRGCFSEQSSLEAQCLWPNFLWWQFGFDVMRWDLTPANAVSLLTVLSSPLLDDYELFVAEWSWWCEANSASRGRISHWSPSSSSGRSAVSVPQLSPSPYLRCAEFTGCCSGLELQTLLMRLLMKAGAHSKSIPLQQLAKCQHTSAWGGERIPDQSSGFISLTRVQVHGRMSLYCISYLKCI